MSRWEDLANRTSEYVVEEQVERKQEQAFRKQVLELAEEGIELKDLAGKLGIDEEIIEQIIKEESRK